MPRGAKSQGAGLTGSSVGRSQKLGAGVSPGDSRHHPVRASSPGGDWQAACAPAPSRPTPRGPASRRGRRLYIPLLGGAGRAGDCPATVAGSFVPVASTVAQNPPDSRPVARAHARPAGRDG